MPHVRDVDEHLVRAFTDTMLICHETCGLDAAGFQKALASLQRIAAGTKLETLARIYTNAARCTHDIKVQPGKYTSREDVSTSTTLRIDAETASIGPVRTVGGGVGVSQSESTSLITIVEYGDPIPVSSEIRVAIQAAADETFTAVISRLKRNGFFLQPESAFYGVWRHRWGNIGFIDFTLEKDGTFEAVLHRDRTQFNIEGLSNWGAGRWSVNNGALTVEMDRVGRTWVPGSVEHHETWFEAKPVLFVDSRHIVFGDKTTLTRQNP
ncbi:MAG: hypothetical protein GXY83_37950 [Rhodopirellula sp.]|nr:hypothetical protein [Rhodopirellula sp.]